MSASSGPKSNIRLKILDVDAKYILFQENVGGIPEAREAEISVIVLRVKARVHGE